MGGAKRHFPFQPEQSRPPVRHGRKARSRWNLSPLDDRSHNQDNRSQKNAKMPLTYPCR